MRTKNHSRFARLGLEILEARLAPAVVVTGYPGSLNTNGYGVVTPGVYRPVAPYVTITPGVAGAPDTVVQRQDVLDPLIVTSAPSLAFMNQLMKEFGLGYTYAQAPSPAGLQLTVKTYYANAFSTISIIRNPITGLQEASGNAGAIIDVAVSGYTPPKGQPVHWIQVVTTDTLVGAPVGAMTTFVDIDQKNRTGTPFYFANDYDQRGFSDQPATSRIQDNVSFKAEVYMVLETAPNKLTIFNDGIQWGYSLKSRVPSNSLALSASSSQDPASPLDRVTLTAKIDGLLGSSYAYPTGRVEFINVTSGIVLGTAPIQNDIGMPKAILANVVFSDNLGLILGKVTVRATYSGDASYGGATTTFVERRVKARADVRLNPAANVVALGQAATFEATVSDDGGSGLVPTGLVTFADGSTILGTGVIDASGHASLTTSSLALGAHTIIASYGGDATFDTATGSAPEEVDASGSVGGHVFLDSNGNSSQDAGEPGLSNYLVTLGGSAPQTALTDGLGNYVFEHVLLGSYAVSVAGPPSMALEGYFQNGTPNTTGTVALTADHPNADLDAAFVTAMASTTTSLSTNNPSPVAGQPQTFNVSVAPTVGWGSPSGTVQLFDNGTPLSSVALSVSSQASFTISLTAGSHTLFALYSGDGTYAGSTSPVLTETVGQGGPPSNTLMMLSESAFWATAGQPVTFTATVSSGNPSSPPTGTLTFYDNGVLMQTIVLTQGMSGMQEASLTLSTLAVGNHTITATYNGDANDAPGSASQYFTVMPA